MIIFLDHPPAFVMPVTTVQTYSAHPTMPSNQPTLLVSQPFHSRHATSVDNNQTSSLLSSNTNNLQLHRPVHRVGQPVVQVLPTAPELDCLPSYNEAMINLERKSEVKSQNS